MLDTLFGSIIFQRKQKGTDFSDHALHDLRSDLINVLSKHGFEFQQYETLALPSEDFPIEKCVRCGLLTSGFSLSELQNEGILEQSIHEILKEGVVENGTIRCSECVPT